MRNDIEKLTHTLEIARFQQEKLEIPNQLEIARLELRLAALENDWAEGVLLALDAPSASPKPVAQQQCPLPWWLVGLGPDDVLVSKGVVEDQETHVRRNI